LFDEGLQMAKRYSVEEVADLGGVSVELIRSYQSKGLIPAPDHEGRRAWYHDVHIQRLRQISELKAQGYSLRMIARTLTGPAAPDGPDLAGAVPDSPEEPLTVAQLAERTEVPEALIRSLEGSGVLRRRRFGEDRYFTTADVRAVRMLMTLLSSGLPMEEFMEAAQVQLESADSLAESAVDLFWKYGRGPLLDIDLTDKEQADRMVASLRVLLHATTTLLVHNFQRMVLNAAHDAIEDEGSAEELETLRQEIRRRRFEVAVPI
jgi:DNA-binding transcriptional MerR regulator